MDNKKENIVHALLLLALLVEVSHGCLGLSGPGVWFTFEQHCYNLVQTHSNWSDAEHDCMQRGGHLAHISNKSEQDAIYKVVEQQHDTRFWIGLNDLKREGQFEWSSGDPAVFIFLGPSSLIFHGVDDCVYMESGSWHSGAWDDRPCSIKAGYICQFENDGSSIIG